VPLTFDAVTKLAVKAFVTDPITLEAVIKLDVNAKLEVTALLDERA
jgi:hypothetical protein